MSDVLNSVFDRSELGFDRFEMAPYPYLLNSQYTLYSYIYAHVITPNCRAFKVTGCKMASICVKIQTQYCKTNYVRLPQQYSIFRKCDGNDTNERETTISSYRPIAKQKRCRTIIITI